MIFLRKILDSSVAEYLYHYTSMEGLIGILSSKELWASNIHFLNDAEEFSLALKITRDSINEIKRNTVDELKRKFLKSTSERLETISRVNVCVFSLSAIGDLLSQWRAYCPSARGYSLGLSSKRLKILAQMQNFYLSPCVYDPKNQKDLIKDILNFKLNKLIKFNNSGKLEANWEIILNETITHIATYAPMIKHFSFSEEKEWRLISQPKAYDDPSYKCRPGKSTIIPYYKFSLTDDAGECHIGPITVGPTSIPELARNGATQLAINTNVKWKGVGNSDIPYRDW